MRISSCARCILFMLFFSVFTACAYQSTPPKETEKKPISTIDISATTRSLSPEDDKIITQKAAVFIQVLRLLDTEGLYKPKNIGECADEMLQLGRNEESCFDDWTRWESDEDAKGELKEKGERFEGIGLDLISHNGHIFFGPFPMPDVAATPAVKAGIKYGDEIVDVNGSMPKDESEAMELIRGKLGTPVHIEVRRDNKIISFNITRESINIPPVIIKTLLPEHIGYIWFNQFGYSQGGKVKKALFEFQKQHTPVVMDLRSNPGGLLLSVLSLLYDFGRTDDIFVTEKFRGSEQVYTSEDVKRMTSQKVPPGRFRDMKIAFIIGSTSASASEIFAGTMKDWGFPVIGAKSFGKGVGQSERNLLDKSVFKMTTFEFFVGNKKTKVHGVGVEPTYKISDDKSYEQLQKAIEVLLSWK